MLAGAASPAAAASEGSSSCGGHGVTLVLLPEEVAEKKGMLQDTETQELAE